MSIFHGCNSAAILPFFLVHLTQTDPKSRDAKSKMVETIRSAIDERNYVFLFSFENMRTSFFQGVRKEWPESRFFLGKNKVMQVALGRDEEDEYATGLSEVATHLKGNVGLLLTDHTLDEVRQNQELSGVSFLRATS